MKSTFAFLFCFVILSFSCFGQNELIRAVPRLSALQAPATKLNYTFFTPRKQALTASWKKRNTKYILHPDAGYTAKEQPPGNVIELFEKRTETSRFYVDADTSSKVFLQGAYGSLHYKKNGQWLSIDSRLDKQEKNIFEASRQIEPVGFDIGKRKSYIKTIHGVVYFNDWKIFGKKNKEIKLLATASWDDYSAGDDGIFIRNIFPGVDAEMRVLRGKIKTNLIIRQWDLPEFDCYVFSDSFQTPEKGIFSFVNEKDNESGIGELDFKANGKLLARIGHAVFYAENDPENVVYMPYSLKNENIGLTVDFHTLKAMLKKGNVVVDPLVTGPQSIFSPTSVMNSYNNANCSFDYNLGCSYNWTVQVPPFIQVTNVHFNAMFLTMAPCTRDKLRWTYGFGDTNCEQSGTWSTIGLPVSPGSSGGNTSITPYYNNCIIAGCVQKDIKVTMSIIRSCMGPAGCESSCVHGVGPFVTTIEGRTVELVSINATPDPIQCAGETVALSAVADFGIKPYTFQWNPGNLSGSNVNVTPASNTSYTVVVKDACNQTVSASKTVSVPPPPPAMTVKISASEANICEGKQVGFSAAVTNTVAPSYQWIINGTNVPGANSASFSSSTIKNDDVISLLVTNSNVCANPKSLVSNEIKMIVNPPVIPAISIVSNATGNAICKGIPVVFNAMIANGGLLPVYQWFKNGSKVGAGLASYSDANLADGDIVSCQLTSNALCVISNPKMSNEISIAVKTPLFVEITKTICPGELPYIWNGLTVNSIGKDIASFKTISRVTGCDSTAVLTLAVSPLPAVVKIDTASCGLVIFDGKIHTVSAVVNDKILNQTGCDSLIRTINITVYPSQKKDETVKLTGCDSLQFEGKVYYNNIVLNKKILNQFGCDSINRTTQIIIEKFDLGLSVSQTGDLYNGDPLTLNATSGIPGYQINRWSPEILFVNQNALKQHLLMSLKDSVFTVFGQSPGGCVDSASIVLRILVKPYGNLLPNVFTPNNDGLNDTWVPIKGIQFPVGELFVYNRWGECIYHTEDYTVPWDGNLRNSKVQVGVYPYRLIVSGKFEFKGTVTVLY